MCSFKRAAAAAQSDKNDQNSIGRKNVALKSTIGLSSWLITAVFHTHDMRFLIDSYYKVTTLIADVDLGYSVAGSLNNTTAFQPPVNRQALIQETAH